MKALHLLSLFCLPVFLIAQEWTQVSSLPDSTLGRNHAISFGLNGYGYILAGNAGGSNQLEDMLRYDPSLDVWQPIEDFPGGKRGYAYGVTNGEKAYVGFGRYFDAELSNTFWHKDLWEFDPQTETWKELAECPCEARIHPAMVATSTKVFVGLGGGEMSGDMNDWWEYDIPSDTWTQKPDFPSTERHHPYYFGMNDQVYVGFGHHSSDIFDDFYHYDPATEIWTPTAQFPAEGRVAGTQFDYQGKGYVLSGQGEDHDNLDIGEFWEYDPETNAWLNLEPHPGTGRWAPASFMIDNYLYFMTGQTDIEEKDMWVYEFEPEVSSSDQTSIEMFHLYPNPAKDFIKLKLAMDHFSFEIFDMMGRLVAKDINKSEINIENLKSGIYYIIIYDGLKGKHPIPFIKM
jgi:N-acetylneuraminic acid mutarotase